MNPGEMQIKSASDKRFFAKNKSRPAKQAVDGFNTNGVRVLSTSTVVRNIRNDVDLNCLQANILQFGVENRHTGVEVFYT